MPERGPHFPHPARSLFRPIPRDTTLRDSCRSRVDLGIRHGGGTESPDQIPDDSIDFCRKSGGESVLARFPRPDYASNSTNISWLARTGQNFHNREYIRRTRSKVPEFTDARLQLALAQSCWLLPGARPGTLASCAFRYIDFTALRSCIPGTYEGVLRIQLRFPEQ